MKIFLFLCFWKKLAVLYESGDLYPCEIIETLHWPDEVRNRFGGNFKIGNVREYNCDVTAMLKSDRGREIQNFIIDSKCYCTFECATNISVLYDLKGYPDLIKRTIQSSFKSRLN